MKKILVSLLVLALCAPAMADVSVTAVGNGADLEISIAVSGGAVVRGLALTLDADAGMSVDTTSAVVAEAQFNAYIDYYALNGVGVDLPGAGAHPLATVGAAGPITGAVEDAVLCLGVLDDGGDQDGYGSVGGVVGDAAGLLATVTYTGSGDVCISEDTLRAGIVGDNLGSVTVQAACVTIGSVECLKGTAPYYDDWVDFGSPACWCNERQCGGDADGLSVGTTFTGIRWCTTTDLDILLAVFNVYEPGGTLNSGPGVGATGICADFDHAGVGTTFTGIRRVTTTDLDILLAGFNVYEPGGTLNSGPGIPTCDVANYNFFN